MKRRKYRAKCLKPGCDWQSDKVYLVVVARNAGKRHERKAGKGHFTKIVSRTVEEGKDFFYFR